MRCKNCGMANADTAKICSECGSPLPAPQPPAEPVKEPVQNAAQPPVQTPQAPVATQPAATAQPATPTIPPVTPQVNMNYPPTPPAYPYYVPPAQPMPYAPVQPPVNTAPPVQQPAPAQENVPQAPVGQNPFGEPLPTAGAYHAAPSAPQAVPPVYTPPMYPPYPYAIPPKDPHGAKATWALALGIVAVALPIITCSLGSPLALICGIVALILGGVSIGKVFPNNKGKAIAGLVLGIVGVLISILSVTMLFNSISTVTNSDEFKQFYDQYNSFIAMVLTNGIRVVMNTVTTVIGRLQMLLKLLFLG